MESVMSALRESVPVPMRLRGFAARTVAADNVDDRLADTCAGPTGAPTRCEAHHDRHACSEPPRSMQTPSPRRRSRATRDRSRRSRVPREGASRERVTARDPGREIPFPNAHGDDI